MAQPADVILDAASDLAPFRAWAAAAEASSFWMQINHPGRVVQRDTGSRALAPSAVPVNVGPLSKLFPTPTPMTASDIQDTVERFAVTAELAERAGFAGVEIHAAHGYLLAQFLSPLVNKRTDQWGGSSATAPGCSSTSWRPSARASHRVSASRSSSTPRTSNAAASTSKTRTTSSNGSATASTSSNCPEGASSHSPRPATRRMTAPWSARPTSSSSPENSWRTPPFRSCSPAASAERGSRTT
ncbi:hypothetical protein NKH77_05550 [Streptomyces sp. M19]